MHGATRPELLCAGLEDLVGKVVVYLGVIAQRFDICGLEQLCAALAKALADGRLHLHVIQRALSGGFFGDELVDRIAHYLVRVRIGNGQHIGKLAGLELGDRAIDVCSALQLRFIHEAHVAAV